MTKGDQIDDREREYLISYLAETESTFFYEEKEKGFFQEEYVVKEKRSDFDRNKGRFNCNPWREFLGWQLGVTIHTRQKNISIDE